MTTLRHQLSVKQMLLQSFLVQKISRLETERIQKHVLEDKKSSYYDKPSKKYCTERASSICSQSPTKPPRSLYPIAQSNIKSPRMMHKGTILKNNSQKDIKFHILHKQHGVDLPEINSRLYHSRSQHQSKITSPTKSQYELQEEEHESQQETEQRCNQEVPDVPEVQTKIPNKFVSAFRTLLQNSNQEQERRINMIQETHKLEIEKLKQEHERVLAQQLRDCEENKTTEAKAVKNNIVRLFMERDVYPLHHHDISQFKAKVSMNSILQDDSSPKQINTKNRNKLRRMDSIIQIDNGFPEMKDQLNDLMNFTDRLIMMFDHHLNEQNPPSSSDFEQNYQKEGFPSRKDIQEIQIENQETNENTYQRNQSFELSIASQVQEINQKIKYTLQRYERFYPGQKDK